LPGSAIIEIVRAACAEEVGPRVELEAVVLRAPLFVSGTRTVRVHVKGEAGRREFVVASRAAAGWTIHATGRARTAPAPVGALVEGPGDDAVVFAPAEPFEPQPGRLRLGPRWAGLRRLELRDSEVRAEVTLPANVGATDGGFTVHPALLDLATGAALSLVGTDEALWVPLGYDRVTCWRELPHHALVRAKRVGATSHGTARFDLDLADANGSVAVRVEGLTMRAVNESALERREGRTGGRGAGIASEDGIDALGRLMASGRRGAVVVSPIPLDATTERRADGRERASLPAYAGDGAVE
jgi:hypothetical protein